MRIRFGAIITGLIAGAIAAVAFLSVKPDILVDATKVTLRSPVAQILAMRGWIILGLAGSALFFAIMGAIRNKLLNRGRIALALAFALTLAAIGHGAIMIQRGVFPASALDGGQGTLTVLEYNTMGGAVSTEDVAYLIEENHVDVATLPETSAATGRELAAMLESGGRSYQVFDNGRASTDTNWGSTVLLIASDLGEYRADADFAASSNILGVRADPASGEGPSFLAVHPVAPSQAYLRSWRTDMYEAYAMCAENPNIIMGGDFNSTADHEAALHLGTPCRDAGAEAGAGGIGTWPSNLPGLLSAPIDRVLTNSAYTGSAARIVDAGGSDHRGIIVKLTPEH